MPHDMLSVRSDGGIEYRASLCAACRRRSWTASLASRSCSTWARRDRAAAIFSRSSRAMNEPLRIKPAISFSHSGDGSAEVGVSGMGLTLGAALHCSASKVGVLALFEQCYERG